MPEFYADDMFEIQEADDFYVDEEMYLDDELYVDEADLNDEVMLIEEPEDDYAMYAKMLPGSDYVWEDEEPEQEVKDTDWANDKDPSKFVQYLRDKLNKVPKHTGKTIPGCERALSFMKALDNEISQAMRADYDGAIDESEIDTFRQNIMDGVDKLERQIKKLRGKKTADANVRLVSNGDCKKCASTTPMWHNIAEDKMVCLSCEAEEAREAAEQITKEAGLPVINVFVTPFERAIVGTIINSKVSAGKHIEETYMLLKNKYNFTPREELGIQQLIADYGYPFYKDRGRLNEEADPAANEGVDWPAQYHA